MSDRGEARSRRAGGLVFAAALMLFLLSAATAVVEILYAPVASATYTAVPPKACPGEPVELRVTATGRGLSSLTGRMTVEGQWQSKGEPGAVLVPEQEISIENTGDEIRGVAIIPIPTSSGEWSLDTEAEVSGRILILPASQRVEAVQSNALTILEEDDPRCERPGVAG